MTAEFPEVTGVAPHHSILLRIEYARGRWGSRCRGNAGGGRGAPAGRPKEGGHTRRSKSHDNRAGVVMTGTDPRGEGPCQPMHRSSATSSKATWSTTWTSR